MTRFQDLPDELLLEIARQVRGRYRNSDLASLSLVSRQFRPIAQEAMFQRPCFKITNIHLFILEMSRQNWLIPKIQSLELWSTDKNRGPKLVLQGVMHSRQPRVIQEGVACPPELWDRLNTRVCEDTIKRFCKKESHARRWLSALKHDMLPAAFGLVLLSLPNLKELRCAASWMMDFPILSVLKSDEVACVRPTGWQRSYFTGIVEKLAPNLEVLEVPTNLEHMRFIGHPTTLFDYTSFKGLKVLSVSMDVLFYEGGRPLRPSPWPVPLLPPNLQILKISEGYLETTKFIGDICKVKKEGKSLQSLTQVEVIYYRPYYQVLRAAISKGREDPVYDIKTFCSSAELAILLYFPGVVVDSTDVNRSLWSLREFRAMPQVEWEMYRNQGSLCSCGCEGSSFDEWRSPERLFSFDADGDVEMLDV